MNDINVVDNMINPVRYKRMKWIESLTIEEKRLIDALDEKMNASSQYIIQSIKRVRTPLINTGDIFAVQIPGGMYLHGRVVETGLENSDKTKLSVIFIFNRMTHDMHDIPKTFDYEQAIIGPEMVPSGFWSRGYFYHVLNIPLSSQEKELDFGFYNSFIRGGIYCDASKKEMDHIPKFISNYGYVTLYGISRIIQEQYILNRIVV